MRECALIVSRREACHVDIQVPGRYHLAFSTFRIDLWIKKYLILVLEIRYLEWDGSKQSELYQVF